MRWDLNAWKWGQPGDGAARHTWGQLGQGGAQHNGGSWAVGALSTHRG